MRTVAQIRKQLGLTSQKALADLLGVNQSTVSRWETGEKEPTGPAAVLLERLAKDARPARKKPNA